MDARTLTALQGSIAKWEAIVYGGGIDMGEQNCPLCVLFFHLRDCDGCPVSAKTGFEACVKSPYPDWLDSWAASTGIYPNGEIFVIDDATHVAAKAELAFLRSLLP
jgi:hypothetical protein